ncbi:hypothetical protein [Cellvibrio japonicus]|uniref:hypothetical protein n=1 Tax=Cellvibrio japonicus TaxID=155077 RepID=UPI0002F3C834|nr:hypothetical protein [Cellvibrio japonicus]QEI13681.1 hypothetical protein FY117_16650 [Cellvibrio japonicus]
MSPLAASLIVGPSYTLRWHQQVRDGVVCCNLEAERIIGLADHPIWSKQLLETARAMADTEKPIGVMIGDLRSGNGICLSDRCNQESVLNDGFWGINSAAITLEYDRQMLQRARAGLACWHQCFGARARYVFWYLFGQQVHDRLAGRYINDTGYRHLTFNYVDVVANLPDLDIVDLSPFLCMPMHEVNRLFIDRNSHPSRIGYLLLNGLLCENLSPQDAYHLAVAEVEADLIALAQQIVSQKNGPVILTGHSIWLDTLSRYLGASGAKRLAEVGLILAPLEQAPGQASIKEICTGLDLSSCAIIVLSAGGADLTPVLAKAFDTTTAAWHELPCIDWESAASSIIVERKEHIKFNRLNTTLPVHTNIINCVLEAPMVELGPEGIPSWAGLKHLMQVIASEQVPLCKLATQSQSKPTLTGSYHIEGDVLLTNSGMAFLIGENHSILKYVSGELVPTQASLDDFNSSIAEQLKIAQQSGISYVHIIFPDKQSVMQEIFPIKSPRRLGDLYLNHLNPALRPYVIYPVDVLAQQSQAAFYPLDSHMTDQGSLMVLRLMLDAIEIKAEDALDRIATRITKLQRRTGDLGEKFTPSLHQNGLMLDCDWPLTEVRSPGDFNNGMIDILFSPEAPVHKTVLVLGDSYFRVMLKHLSAIFTRVVCLYTSSLPREMISLIRPDILFIGTVEHTLSNTKSDSETDSFPSYLHLWDGTDTAIDREFLSAWDAVTSPTTEKSQAYFTAKGVGENITTKATTTAAKTSAAPTNTINRKLPLKGLIATHHLYRWGGSELVAIELAEALRQRTCNISIYSPFAEVKFLDEALGSDIRVFTAPEQIQLQQFDFVYCQHQTLSRIIPQQKGDFPFRGSLPVFIYNHLSPFEQFEFPGPFIEEQLADIIMCNSQETARRLSMFGSRFTDTLLFPNPAPESFEAPVETHARYQLKRLLSVSSHLPKELDTAFSILREQGIEVTRIGAPDNERRVQPGDISSHDAVVTIGKTVQYALRSKRPIFCYDYLGGPGWVDSNNREVAGEANFSGRSHPRHLSPETIVQELLGGFSRAFSEVQGFAADLLAPYHQEKLLDDLLERIHTQKSCLSKLHQIDKDQWPEIRRRWAHEADIYHLLDRTFLAGNPYGGKIHASVPIFKKRVLEQPYYF